MKLGENKYLCGFCGTIIDKIVDKRIGEGRRSNMTAQLLCTKCGSLVSQKTSSELRELK